MSKVTIRTVPIWHQLARWSQAVLLGIALGACAATGRAQLIVNGGFESGSFTGWNTLGSTTVETSGFGVTPPEGTYQAFLDSNSTTVAQDLEVFLFGSSSGQLSSIGYGTAYQGSAITMQQTVTLAAGQTVQFKYDFLTSEDPTDSTHGNDFAFLTVGTTGGTLAYPLASVDDPPKALTLAPANSPGFTLHSGYVTSSFDAPQAGTYTFGFGVVDESDGAFPSGILVDSITVVPEPMSYAVCFGAALFVFGMARRIKGSFGGSNG